VHTVTQDKEDERISFISTDPGFGINQTRKYCSGGQRLIEAILIETSEGSYIWDCAAYIGLPLVSYLSSLSKPLKAIAISHPHVHPVHIVRFVANQQFFATSLTWSRAIGVPLYLNEADKDWFQRLGDLKDTDEIVWWTGRKELGPGVTLVQCGGCVHPSTTLTVVTFPALQFYTGTDCLSLPRQSTNYRRNLLQCLE